MFTQVKRENLQVKRFININTRLLKHRSQQLGRSKECYRSTSVRHITNCLARTDKVMQCNDFKGQTLRTDTILFAALGSVTWRLDLT